MASKPTVFSQLSIVFVSIVLICCDCVTVVDWKLSIERDCDVVSTDSIHADIQFKLQKLGNILGIYQYSVGQSCNYSLGVYKPQHFTTAQWMILMKDSGHQRGKVEYYCMGGNVSDSGNTLYKRNGFDIEIIGLDATSIKPEPKNEAMELLRTELRGAKEMIQSKEDDLKMWKDEIYAKNVQLIDLERSNTAKAVEALEVRESLQKELARAQDDIHSLQEEKQCQTVQSEAMAQSIEDFSNLGDQNRDLSNVLHRARETLSDVGKERDSLQLKNQEQSEWLESYLIRIEHLQREVGMQQRKNAEVEQQLGTARSDLKERQIKCDNFIHELETKRDLDGAKEIASTEREQQRRSLNERISSLEQSEQQKDEMITRLEQQLESTCLYQSKLKDEIFSLHETVQQQRDVQERAAMIECHSKICGESQRESDIRLQIELEEATDRSMDEMNQLKTQNQERHQSDGLSEQQIRALKEENDSLQEMLKQQQEKAGVLQEEKAEVIASETILKETVIAIQTTVKSLDLRNDEQLSRSQTEISEIESKLAICQKNHVQIDDLARANTMDAKAESEQRTRSHSLVRIENADELNRVQQDLRAAESMLALLAIHQNEATKAEDNHRYCIAMI